MAVEAARAESLLQFQVFGHEMLIALFMQILLHGLIIPNRWQRTAVFAILMGLAPFAAFVLFRILQPELYAAVASAVDSRSISVTMQYRELFICSVQGA